MESGSTADKILRSRALLVESCADLAGEIKALKCNPLAESVVLTANMDISDELTKEFSNTLVSWLAGFCIHNI